MGGRAVAAGAGCAVMGASKLTLKFGILCSDTWRLYMLGRVTAVLCGPEVKEQKALPGSFPVCWCCSSSQGFPLLWLHLDLELFPKALLWDSCASAPGGDGSVGNLLGCSVAGRDEITKNVNYCFVS